MSRARSTDSESRDRYRTRSRAGNWLRITLIVVACICSDVAISQAQQPRPSEYQVEAAYLYNFGKFVNWPDSGATVKRDSFEICVLGEDPFGSALDAALDNQRIDGNSVVAKRITAPQEAATCRILFISSSEDNRLKVILAALDRSRVLAVSDIPKFSQRGGMIGFTLKGNKVRFEVNSTSTHGAGLMLSLRTTEGGGHRQENSSGWGLTMFTNDSISTKLTWMNMLVSGAALLTACIALIGYDLVTFRSVEVSNLSTQAQIAASNSISALLFDDPQAAQNTLSALKTAPNIKSAGIYRSDGHPFASYSRDQGGLVPALPPVPPGEAQAYRFVGNQVVLVRLIVSEGKPIGMVYMQSDSQMLNARLRRYAGICALVLAVSLLAALLVSSMFRRAVAEPIVHLAEVARSVSRDKNYSVRAMPSTSGSELIVLVDAFNEMLVQIQERDGALQKGRDELEQRVHERTAELETAKKEVEEYSFTIFRAKGELERASKFKDQFLSTMSHELRTPLNAILGFSELLPDVRYGPLNDRQRRYVAHIHTSGQHLLSLINDILDLSKIEAGRLALVFESVRVGATFEDVLDTLRPLADKKSHTLSQRVEDDLYARADATRFKQVLMNLVGNAIKFMPESGRIELVARVTEGKVRVEVRDTGPGIPAEEQKRIFESFYPVGRTRRRGASHLDSPTTRTSNDTGHCSHGSRDDQRTTTDPSGRLQRVYLQAD